MKTLGVAGKFFTDFATLNGMILKYEFSKQV